jgi:transcriptional activator SPT8
MQHDEKGFFSAGWDGESLVIFSRLTQLVLTWIPVAMDLDTGQIVRNFTAHGAQLAAIAVRPIASGYTGVFPSAVA